MGHLRKMTDEETEVYEVRKYDHNVDRGPVRQAKWILSRSGSGSKIDDSR